MPAWLAGMTVSELAEILDARAAAWRAQFARMPREDAAHDAVADVPSLVVLPRWRATLARLTDVTTMVVVVSLSVVGTLCGPSAPLLIGLIAGMTYVDLQARYPPDTRVLLPGATALPARRARRRPALARPAAERGEFGAAVPGVCSAP